MQALHLGHIRAKARQLPIFPQFAFINSGSRTFGLKKSEPDFIDLRIGPKADALCFQRKAASRDMSHVSTDISPQRYAQDIPRFCGGIVPDITECRKRHALPMDAPQQISLA
jgi:hypothetical protein